MNPQDEHTDIDIGSPGSIEDLGDRLVGIACRQLQVSNKFKQPLLEKWKRFENLKAGNVPKKLRVQFNVALPVFSGMLDTLAADFDEPIELEFKRKHPSDYFKVQRIQAAWNMEKAKLTKESRWDFKARTDKSTNIMYGRSILKEFAESDPTYKNSLSTVLPHYFHNQPKGGGLLENHLFAGEEGIMRTEGDLLQGAKDGIYNSKRVSELIRDSASSEYESEVTDYNREKLTRFKVLGLDVESNNYIGERTFNLCEWILTYKGKRYYLLFDPWTMKWIRFAPLKDVFSKELYPWVSWASFEDEQVFWTPAYADICYPVADSIVTLFNQELTNREKRNMGARAYDKDMFPDVAKLDAAQYRADALVPVDTKGGTRKIQDGIYYFQTAELEGTINLLDWTNTQLQRDMGVSDISQGVAVNASKKVNVAYMEQANIAKRLGYKSQSYTEAWGEIGLRYVQGLKDHMSKEMYIEVLGDMGIEPDVLTREDLDLKGDIGVDIISSTARKAENEKKRQGRIKMYELLAPSQNVNSELKDAGIMRDVGQLSEEQIKMFLDTRNYASRESVAKAHIVIQELLAGDKPEHNYAADIIFIKIIYDYMMEHRNKLGIPKAKKFAAYIAQHAKDAMDNGKRNGAQRGQQNQRRLAAQGKGAPQPTGKPGQPQPGRPMPAQPQPEVAQAGATM